MKQARRDPRPVRFYGYPIRYESLWDELRAEWRQVLVELVALAAILGGIAWLVFWR